MSEKQTTKYKGKDVQEIRKKLGLTQEELAQLLGVSSKTISRWETSGISSEKSASARKLIELKKVTENKGGLNAIKDALGSAQGILGISAAASVVSALSPILAGGIFGTLIGATLLKVIKDITKNE